MNKQHTIGVLDMEIDFSKKTLQEKITSIRDTLSHAQFKLDHDEEFHASDQIQFDGIEFNNLQVKLNELKRAKIAVNDLE